MIHWITAWFDLLASFVPRFVKIRSTHRGVKWPNCREPVEMLPGIRWVWPLVTEWEVIVVARQTDPLPPQCLTLRSGRTVAVKGLTVYRVADIVKAYGSRNWDVTTTVQDLSMAAITEIVTGFEDLSDVRGINQQITTKAKQLLEEYGVEVESCRLVEASNARTFRLLGQEVV